MREGKGRREGGREKLREESEGEGNGVRKRQREEEKV